MVLKKIKILGADCNLLTPLWLRNPIQDIHVNCHKNSIFQKPKLPLMNKFHEPTNYNKPQEGLVCVSCYPS
jgi:hypothetical protein